MLQQFDVTSAQPSSEKGTSRSGWPAWHCFRQEMGGQVMTAYKCCYVKIQAKMARAKGFVGHNQSLQIMSSQDQSGIRVGLRSNAVPS